MTLVSGGFCNSAWAISATLTAPAAKAVFAAPAAITLTATATPTNTSRPIVKVEFFRGTTLIGTDTTSPYSFTWSNVPAGTYSLTAKATDSTGATATSAARSIKVDAPPTVNLTAPANNAVFSPGSSIALTATAADSDGTISKVEFFRGTTLIGSDTTSPYSFNWTNVATGNYTLTAKATDNNSIATTSAPVVITVDTPPTVSITAPANDAAFVPPANITVTASTADTDGTVAKVDFFDGATLVGTKTATPFSVTLANLAAGTHALTARATDNLGLTTTSAVVTIRVDAAPGVSITSPANGTVFTPPANVTVSASATDTDGTVAKVDFFDGATLVGTATVAPYSVTLANLTAGTHALTARATDNQGAVTTSAAVSIVVNTPPAISITTPVANAVFTAPANVTVTATASDADGTVSKVDFFDGTTLVGTATSAPFFVTLANAAAGSHTLTARATDDRGAATTSAAVAIRIDAVPTVNLTSPANGATYTAPTTIGLAAAATDTDGTIAKVDFFLGTTLVGTAIAVPYSSTLNNVAAGTYSFTAVATDNDGATTTSEAVSVTVVSGVAQMYYIHPDHLNTPRLIADSTGTPVWRWDNQEPFGNNTPNGAPNDIGNPFDFPVRFPGQYFDRETNLAYNMARDYDSAVGRYVQSDPIGLVGGVNTYFYVDGNPLSYVDPTGESGIPGLVYGALAGGVGGYISSGGNLSGAFYGAVAGGAVGFFNPFASYTLGAAAGGFAASVAGQFMGNLNNPCKDDPFDIDYTQATIAGLAGGGSKVLFDYLGNPRRTAFTYLANQALGPTNPLALNTAQAALRGSISGGAQLAYVNAYYPRNYGKCSCQPN
jgi:RHS repeat-associated protein